MVFDVAARTSDTVAVRIPDAVLTDRTVNARYVSRSTSLSVGERLLHDAFRFANRESAALTMSGTASSFSMAAKTGNGARMFARRIRSGFHVGLSFSRGGQ